jgi:hypothetical protein
MAVTAISSLLSAQNTQDRIAIKGVVYSQTKIIREYRDFAIAEFKPIARQNRTTLRKWRIAFENVAKELHHQSF